MTEILAVIVLAIIVIICIVCPPLGAIIIGILAAFGG